MASRVETEAALNKEHALREVRRASTYLLNVVVAGLILAAGAVPQLVAGEFMPLIFAVSVAGALAVLLCVRIALHWDRAVVLRLGHFYSPEGSRHLRPDPVRGPDRPICGHAYPGDRVLFRKHADP